jgi:hypothetical protein
MRRNIVIVGDSHTEAIKIALRSLQSLLVNDIKIQVYRFSKVKDGRQVGDLSEDRVFGIVSELAPTDLVVSAIGGNQHQVVSLIQHPIPYDLLSIRSDENASIKRAEVNLIPYNTFFEYFWNGIVNGKDGKRLSALKDHSRSPIIHLAPPPPKKDSHYINKNHESHFSKSGILDYGVSPSELRLNVWRLQIEVYKKYLLGSDIGLLLPPKKSMDCDGFLAEDYSARDATHGNNLYGELVIDQLLSYIKEINLS